MKGLTKRQLEVLQYIEQHIQSKKFSPSYRDIQSFFGFRSIATVQKHIAVLKRKGMIFGEKNGKRSIIPSNAAVQDTDQEIILVGEVSNGNPLSIYSKSETIKVPQSYILNPSLTYAIKIKGDSFNEEFMLDGDILLIEARSNVVAGEAILGYIYANEAIIKKYYPEDNFFIRLVSQSPFIEAIMVKEDELVIQGAIISLIRHY
ncbi:LexA repressor [Candidatus Rubidus massiliensis]|nr:MAG: repressor LexA [Chlamydia sp. 32-24]CDZ80091.1 LexA repressor [Candidatus Rubidus massiliensis]